VFSSALARDAEELLKRRAEIVAQPSATTEEVREEEQIAEAAEGLRQPMEELADEKLGVALDDPEIGDPFHWEVEFPEVFLTAAGRPREDGGFDAIVGNPPYIQIQSLGRATAEFCRGRYRAAAGAFDVYIVFIERALELLGLVAPRALLTANPSPLTHFHLLTQCGPVYDREGDGAPTSRGSRGPSESRWRAGSFGRSRPHGPGPRQRRGLG
jgi:hypothetical protein